MNKRNNIKALLLKGWCSQMVANSRYHPNGLTLRKALSRCDDVADIISPVQTWAQTPQGHTYWDVIQHMEWRDNEGRL